jgi:photosystem II stability/assembly factor-like uncharacterized protein
MITKILITTMFFILTVMKLDSQPVTLNENNIKFEDSQTAVLVGQDGLAMRTVDGGNNWTVLNTGVTNSLKSNDFYSIQYESTTSKIHLAVGENGLILKSVDDGATWEVKNSGTTEHLNDVYILNMMLAVACGNNGTVLYSHDFGDNWTALQTGSTENLNSITFVEGDNHSITTAGYLDGLTGIAAGDNGTILTSKGLFASWGPITTGTTEHMNSVYNVNWDVIFAAGNAGTMLQSSDKGATWSTVVSGTTENIHEIKFVDSSTTAIASCDNGVILKSLDGGMIWDIIKTPTTNDLFAVNFGSSEFGITVGEGGTELYTTDGGATWETKEETSASNMTSTKNSDVILMQNYPNPFNPSTIITYALPFDAQVSVKIYDMLGKEVRTLVSSQQNSGTYNVSFNASNMASGIYFYVLRASTGSNEMTKTMRMILTK